MATMQMPTAIEDRALFRIGLGTQAKFDTLKAANTFDAGAVYVATQDDNTHVKMYIAQAPNKAYALSTDYADRAGGWAAGRNFAISGLPSDTTVVSVDGTHTNGYLLNLPKTLGSSSAPFTTIYANTFNGTATNATTASKLSTATAGSATKPVYFANGIPVECNEDLDIKAKAFHAPVTITLGKDLKGSVTFDGSTQDVALEAEVVGAGKVANNLTLKFGTGTTEGQDVYTFNGEVAKTAQLVVDGSYLKMTTEKGKITLSAGETLEDLHTVVTTINNDYTKRSEAAAYAADAATKMYNKILTGQEDGNGTGPAAALDTLYEIANALAADDTAMAELLANINTRAKVDGTNISPTTWDNLTAGAATKWAAARMFAISGTASDDAAKGISVDGSDTKGYTLLLPKTLSGFTTISATTFNGNATTATTATKLGTTTVGSASVPIYLDAGTPKACTSINLNAASATKLATGRTFAVGGLLTGTSVKSATENTIAQLFDGSNDCYIHVTKVAATSLNTPIKLHIGAMEKPIELNVSESTFEILAEDIGSTVVWETF